MPLRFPPLHPIHFGYHTFIDHLGVPNRERKAWGLQNDYGGVLISKNKKGKAVLIKDAQTKIGETTQASAGSRGIQCSETEPRPGLPLLLLVNGVPPAPSVTSMLWFYCFFLTTIILAYIKNGSRAGGREIQNQVEIRNLLCFVCLLKHLCRDP